MFKSTLVFIWLLLLSGCSSVPDDRSSSLTTSLKMLGQIFSPPVVSKTQAEKLPYASISANFDGNAAGLMVLGYFQENVRKWYSSDQYVLETRHDQIAQIYTPLGLQVRSQRFEFYAGNPLQDLRVGERYSLTYLLDFPSLSRFGLVADSQLVIVGIEDRKLWGETVALQKISECLTIRDSEQEWCNYYWRDPQSKFIWESEQYWGQGPRVYLQVLKPWTEVAYP